MEYTPEGSAHDDGSFGRFDDIVRSERYFTATLLPAILFHQIHGTFNGVRSFLDLVDARAKTERNQDGDLVEEKGGTEYGDFQDLEVITEFHIARDLEFARLPLESDVEPSDEGEQERRDAPDLVIAAGRELVVCEGKFFSDFNVKEVNNQLHSQRLQVRYLFRCRPRIRAYRHVAILPWPLENVDADAVLTWDDIRKLSEAILGPRHYVTVRLHEAVKRAEKDPEIPIYEGRLSFLEMREKCRVSGNKIQVGHAGGESDLLRLSLLEVERKRWKWRYPEPKGRTIRGHWLGGARWLEIVESRHGFKS